MVVSWQFPGTVRSSSFLVVSGGTNTPRTTSLCVHVPSLASLAPKSASSRADIPVGRLNLLSASPIALVTGLHGLDQKLKSPNSLDPPPVKDVIKLYGIVHSTPVLRTDSNLPLTTDFILFGRR